MKNRNEQGLTLVEVAVTLMAFGFIMLFTFGMMGGLSRALTKNNQMTRAQSDARVALDMLEADLRGAGAEIDYARGQRSFVHADPYTVIFNANLFPPIDDGTGTPSALTAGAGGAGVPNDAGPLYLPARTFGTGAETVYLSLDSNRDGRVTADDKTDDREENSVNPNDYVLYRGIFGSDNGNNDADMRPIALVRGPEPTRDGTRPQPLFSYWIDDDDDRSTDARLHGDANGDGELNQAEIAALTPLVGGDLARIERINITVTAESVSPDGKVATNDGYLRHELHSQVQTRQRPRTTAVVYGRVWRDLNADGVFNANEPALADALIQSSAGFSTKSRGNGFYRLDVAPGAQVITETDPTGYVSTTPNEHSVDLYPGDFRQIDFGDNIGTGTGVAIGYVFDDLNENGVQDADEPGLPGVKIYADGGEYTFTQDNGSYVLDVPLGNRTISEFDPDGYLSTTPNSIALIFDTPGQMLTANFGDAAAQETGTLQGWVYLDSNRNGVRDSGEPGVLGAQVVVLGQGIDTDGSGFFSMTVPTGVHAVSEIDPPGYTSTTSNTLNGVVIDVDQTVTVMFGDIVEEDVDFDVIELADTERALSIVAGDVREDTHGDPDLMLGTRFSGGINNLLVWENQHRNASTPNGAIFSSTPTYSRANLADVTALAAVDLDGDRDRDLVSGLSETVYPLLNVWRADRGVYPLAPTQTTSTMAGVGIVDFAVGDLDNDGDKDIVAGIRDADYLGHVEIWWNDGQAQLFRTDGSVIRYSAWGASYSMGEANGVALGDVNDDGWLDLFVGAADSYTESTVSIYLRQPYSIDNPFAAYQAFRVRGKVNDIAAVDMVEDDSGDVDILVATEHYSTGGGIEQWNMAEDRYFGAVNEGSRSLDDWMPTDGAPVSMVTGFVDNDVFPDIFVGTRASDVYFTGHVQLARNFGYMPSEPRTLETSTIGVVMSMTGADFNLDNVLDIAIGTQEASNRGKVYVFYRR